MDKALYSKVKIEDAEEIIKRIIEDANSQADSMLAAVKKEMSAVIEQANHEAESHRKEILKKNEAEIEKIKQKIFSTLNLEKKKLFLEEKSRFIESIFEKARIMAVEFRNTPEYKGFLEKAILEGFKVIAEPDAEVLYSPLDEGIIKNINISNIRFKKSDFKDIGVIVRSSDSRLIFDNTFSARLKRMYEDIYMDLLKGVF